MAVFQATKKKARPVLDFRELNGFVACHTGSDIIDVCDEKWRQLEVDESGDDWKEELPLWTLSLPTYSYM